MKKSIDLNFEVTGIYPAIRKHILIQHNKKLMMMNV